MVLVSQIMFQNFGDVKKHYTLLQPCIRQWTGMTEVAKTFMASNNFSTCRLVGEPKAELIRRRPVEPLISISAKARQKNYAGWARLATRKRFPEGVQKIVDIVAKDMEEALFALHLPDSNSFSQ